MKKSFIILIVFVLISGFISAQSQRLVLAEEFTNACCGPCGYQNPAFDALLQQNTDKITSIKYHMSWPGPDPMYSHNTVDNNARRSVYGVNGVPEVNMDGSWWNGSPAQVNQARINNAYAIPSPFEITVQHELVNNNSEIRVKALVKATQDVSSSNLRLFLVVIEKHIHFNNPPGTNGEKDFYNVMKKILPDKNGYKLNSEISNGSYFIVESSWELANVYNNDELAVVAFIQDMSTLEVFQAANSTVNPLPLIYNNDVEIMGIKYATQKNCSGTMEPVVEVRNNGNNDLASMEVKYKVNDGEEHTINWTGSLNSLQKTDIVLSDLSFPVLDTNNLTIYISSVNGANDEYVNNNTYNYQFYRADVVESAFLIIYLDNNPDETTWKLFKSSGEVVQQGGPYSGSGQKIEVLNFSGSDCYRLEMYDAGNNGFTGNGMYIVAYGNNNISFEGKHFTDKDVNEISYDIVGVNKTPSYISHFQLYPNPVSDNVNVSFLLSNKKDVTVEIIDMQGKVVKNIDAGTYNTGEVKINIDINDLNKGLYLLKVDAGGDIMIDKLSIK